MKELGDRSCRRARPRTTPSIAPTLARAPEPAILTTREKSKATTHQVMWCWWQPLDGDHERQHHTRCPDDGAAHLLPSSPRVAAQCTSGLPVDSSDGPELLSCEVEGWDEHLWVNAI